MSYSVVLYQFLQSLMMLSPGFANCQSDPPGHTHDALLEYGPLNVITMSETKSRVIRQISALPKTIYLYKITTSMSNFHINTVWF